MTAGFLGVPSCLASGMGRSWRLLRLPVKCPLKSPLLTLTGVLTLGSSCKCWGLKGALNTEDRREPPVNLGDFDLSWWLCAK